MTAPHPEPTYGATPADPSVYGQPPAPVLIREWHTMTADEQTTEWTTLVNWVIWIHDLYELSREERLPLCWPHHPGLVEELRSLKAWREHTYDHPDAVGAPHTARSWHGELRQTITAAITFWAPACRTGHTDAEPLATAHPDLPEQWRQVGPPVMASAPEPTPRDDDGSAVVSLSKADMLTALRDGTAHRHSRAMPFYAHHAGSWWTRDDDGATWHRCHDERHAAELDRTSAQLRAADTAHDHLTQQHPDQHPDERRTAESGTDQHGKDA